MPDTTYNSEILGQDELAQITGCCRSNDKITWLTGNNWVFVRNRAGEPIVGRLYARLRLSGIDTTRTPAAVTGWTPDFSRLG